MGTATAGIAHAAITAHILGIPMGYVRSEPRITAAEQDRRPSGKRPEGGSGGRLDLHCREA